MALEFELLGADDKPALLVLSHPEWLEAAQKALLGQGYKVHQVSTHEEFPNKYGQVPYQVVVIEERFAGSGLGANPTLQFIQTLPMAQRRHTTFFLIGESLTTMHPMQAYVQSVHAVIHPNDLGQLSQIIQRVVGENDLFLFAFRDVQAKLAGHK